MNNLSNKVNQNAKEKYRTYNSVNPHLSSTSVSNMSTKNNNNMIGGNQKRCIEALNSFNSKNIELALYIINSFDCDWSCQDQNGNTILHHIVLCSKTNQECLSTIKLVLSNANIKSFIDKQNNEGQTAMLLAVLNGMDKIAYELEKAGANKTIEDNYGNLIQTDKEIEDSDDEVKYDMSDYATPNENMLTNNLLKLIVPSETNNNLSSLNLSELIPVENNDFSKINFSDNSSDQFINMIKNNLQDLMNKQDNLEMDNNMDNNMLDNEPSSTTEDFIQVLSNKYKNNKNLYNNNSRDLLHKKIKNDSHPININNYNLIIDSDKINSFAPKSSKKMLKSKMNDDSDLTSSFVPTNKHNKLLDSKTSDDSDVTSSFVPTNKQNKLLDSKTSDDNDVTSSFVPTNKQNKLLDSKTSDDSDVTSSFAPTNKQNKLLDSKTSDDSDATSSFMPTNNHNELLDSNTSDDLNQFTKSLKNKMNSTKKSSSFEKKINTKKSSQNADSDIDTDDLMKVIGNVQKDMTGGTINSNKIMGYRKLKLHSDIEGELDEENIDDLEDNSDNEEEDEEELEETETETENTNEEKTKPKTKSKVYIDESDNDNEDNELSRLINSRKNEIHNEVINTIMGMLNQGEILYKNKPIKSSERNAKLIKSYLYKKVSEKNPQLTGMDKILIIQKMSKTELLSSLKEMPDLDELEKTIETHMQTKKEQYESEDNKKSKKNNNKKEPKNDEKKEPKNDEKKSKSTKETKSKKSKKEIIETETDSD